jgi:AsmA protein
MKRLWKLIGSILGLLVLAFVIAAVAITLLVDPNQFKPLITAQFKKITGFEMNIPGNLSWSFYPHFGVKADEVAITDPAVFSAKVKNLNLHLQIKPLLHKQVELSRVSMSHLNFNQLQASRVETKVQLKDQQLKVKSLDADFYQGHIHSDTTVSMKQTPYPLHITGEAKQVNAAEFLKALSQKANPKIYLDGQANVAADLSTSGNNKNELFRRLNGTTRFSLDKGALKGIDIGYYLDTAAALINKQPLPARAMGNQTDFGKMSGTAVVKNGVLNNDDLLIEALLYTIKGKGSINLVNNTINFRLEVSAKPGETETNKVLALYGKTIPVIVSGSLDNPKVTLDTLSMMEQVGKEQIQKVQDKIQKALPEEANKLIQNLFH